MAIFFSVTNSQTRIHSQSIAYTDVIHSDVLSIKT